MSYKEKLLIKPCQIVTLEEVCAVLKDYGVNIDLETVRRYYHSEEQLASLENNLWMLLRIIMTQGSLKSSLTQSQ
jgi:hypothetical protein